MSVPQLFVIGDSISIGYGPHLERMTAGVFAYGRKSGEEEALKNLDVATGANGGDSSMVLSYLQAMVADESWRPDYLLINCGLHDLRFMDGVQQIPVEPYAANLQAMLDCLKGTGIRLFWVRTTPVDDEQHNSRADFQRYAKDAVAYNEAADAVMRAAGVPLIDLFTFTANLGSTEEIFRDHVHFFPAIEAQQAAYIAGYMQVAIG